MKRELKDPFPTWGLEGHFENLMKRELKVQGLDPNSQQAQEESHEERIES